MKTILALGALILGSGCAGYYLHVSRNAIYDCSKFCEKIDDELLNIALDYNDSENVVCKCVNDVKFTVPNR